MSRNGTAAYGSPDSTHDVPELVEAAVAAARSLNFELCVRPEIGRLLATLAGGLPTGARVAETGTGTGAGLAWMVSAARADVTFISYELEPARAAAAQQLFEHHSNVTVVGDDAAVIFGHGPFDLLVLDGGPGSGKIPDSVPVDPERVLRPGGTLTIDDFTPVDHWPPTYADTPDEARIHWLSHPALRSTEIRVAPDLAVVVCRYLPTL